MSNYMEISKTMLDKTEEGEKTQTARTAVSTEISKRPLHRAMLVLVLMLMLATGVFVLKPSTIAPTAEQQNFQLEALVPSSFGDWRIDNSVAPILPDPETLAKIEKIYNQTLSRTYINTQGQRIMLSLAYGSDQAGALRAHRPEQCYSAQGFSIRKLGASQVQLPDNALTAQRLYAVNGQRHEPITYWIRIGDAIATNNTQVRMLQLQYTLKRQRADGMLVRVSSIDTDQTRAFALQDQFLADLYRVLPASTRALLGRGSLS